MRDKKKESKKAVQKIIMNLLTDICFTNVYLIQTFAVYSFIYKGTLQLEQVQCPPNQVAYHMEVQTCFASH